MKGMVNIMKDLKKALEENYLTFVAIAAGVLAGVALIVWAITYFVKRVHK
jgi:hypothetical protein